MVKKEVELYKKSHEATVTEDITIETIEEAQALKEGGGYGQE